ncbi:MAG: hypothetical protein RR555_01595 [Bacteroidales bacterium]
MKKLFTLLFCATFIFCACESMDFKDTKVPIDTTIPMTDFDITESMLLSWAGLEENISTGDDNILQIEQELKMEIATQKDLSGLFTIKDQNFTISHHFGGVIPVSIVVPINITLLQNFQYGKDYSIRAATLAEGTLNFSIANTTADFSQAVCEIPQLTKDNLPLKIKSGENVSLKGYKLNFSPDNPNQIQFLLSGKITALKGDDLSNVSLGISFSHLMLADAEGFFGREIITPNQEFTIQLDPGVTDFFKDCNYYLANPQLKLQLNNTHNLPLLVKISKLKIGNTNIQLKDAIGSSKIVVKPEYISDYVLDNSDTQSGRALSDALSKQISSVTISFTVITNPTKEDLADPAYVAPTTNHISLDKSLKIQENIIIPFEGFFSDIPFSQEFDMDMGNHSDILYEHLKLGVLCRNEMPLNLKLTLVAVSADGSKTPLLSDPIMIPPSNGLKPSSGDFQAGIINETNPVIQTIPGDKVQLLMTAQKLQFVFSGSMPVQKDGGYSKLYSPSRLKLKLIGNLKGLL